MSHELDIVFFFSDLLVELIVSELSVEPCHQLWRILFFFFFNEILLIYQKREVLFSFGMEFFSCCLRDGHWMHLPDVDRIWNGNLLLDLITLPIPLGGSNYKRSD